MKAKTILMSLLLAVFLQLPSSEVFSQSFLEKPFTAGRTWIDSKMTKDDVLKNIPQGYKVKSDEGKELTLVRKEDNTEYIISCGFIDGKLDGLKFTIPAARSNEMKSELTNELGYKFFHEEDNLSRHYDMYTLGNIQGGELAIIMISQNNDLVTGIMGKFHQVPQPSE